MKICPECRTAICEPLLVCMACTLRKSRRGVEGQQLEPLRMAEEGEVDLIIRAQGGVRHIQMFRAEETFCGRRVYGHDRKNFLPWDEYQIGGGRVCQLCRAELQRVKEEHEAARQP